MGHPQQKNLGAGKYGSRSSSWFAPQFRALLSAHFTQVAVPYLRAKAHDYYEQLGGGVSSDILEDAGDARRIQALTDDVRHFSTNNDDAYGRVTVFGSALASSIQEKSPMGEHLV